MKGKGCPSGKKASSSDDETSCPLQLSEFEVIDIEKLCPRFHAVTNRSEEEGVGLEDLDVLQNELENMLVSVSRRQMSIESDIEALNSWNESTRPQPASGKLSKVATPIKSESGTRSESRRSEVENKRKARMDDVVDSPRITKKVKSECISSPLGSSASSISSCSSTVVPSGSKFKSKSKNLSMKMQPTSTVTTQYHEPVASQVPDKFYSFIEPYCAPIKPEHVKILEEMIANYTDEALDEYMKIPNLGKHYTLKWSLNDSVSNGSVSPTPGTKGTPKGKKKKAKGDNDPSADSFETPQTPTPAKKGKKKTESTFGPFTQRLLQALLETPSELSDALTSVENTEDEATEDNSSRPSSPGKGSSKASKGTDVKLPLKNPPKTGSKKVTKALNLGNTSQLEKRIKKELVEAGLLELDDGSSLVEDEDDEILRELIKAQNELRMVTQQNKSQLQSLLSKANLDMARQEIQGKLRIVDEEVIEVYRKLTALKSKKKVPSKKERDAAIKALKERDELIQQLDTLSC